MYICMCIYIYIYIHTIHIDIMTPNQVACSERADAPRTKQAPWKIIIII